MNTFHLIKFYRFIRIAMYHEQSFVYIQLNDRTVLCQTIQFSLGQS